MSIRRETPCDFGECPYSAEYSCSCEYWCGEDEPQDNPEDWEDEFEPGRTYWDEMAANP